MEIRIARQEDLSEINRIYNQAVQQRFCTAHLEPVKLEDRKSWFQNHDPAHFPIFVILEEKQILGWASLGPYREDRQALTHVAEVSYYVEENERGKGVGGSLMDHVMKVVSNYGFTILVAILLDKNPASIALLKKFGFDEWGRMPGIAQIGGLEVDHLYYGLKL